MMFCTAPGGHRDMHPSLAFSRTHKMIAPPKTPSETNSLDSGSASLMQALYYLRYAPYSWQPPRACCDYTAVIPNRRGVQCESGVAAVRLADPNGPQRTSESSGQMDHFGPVWSRDCCGPVRNKVVFDPFLVVLTILVQHTFEQ